MGKIYELTDKHWKKYLVRGIKSDTEAKKVAKKVFKKYYWKRGVTHYADTKDKIPSMTKKRFFGYGARY